MENLIKRNLETLSPSCPRQRQAVEAGFRACQAMWGRGEGELSPNGSLLSDATTADEMVAASSSSADVGNENDFELWDEFDEFADVSGWTEEQVRAMGIQTTAKNRLKNGMPHCCCC